MQIIVGHMYVKVSIGDKYSLRRIEHNKKKTFVLLEGSGNTVRRVELAIFERDYKKVRVKKTAS